EKSGHVIPVFVCDHKHIDLLRQRGNIRDDGCNLFGTPRYRAVNPAIDKYPEVISVSLSKLQEMRVADSLAVVANRNETPFAIPSVGGMTRRSSCSCRGACCSRTLLLGHITRPNR